MEISSVVHEGPFSHFTLSVQRRRRCVTGCWRSNMFANIGGSQKSNVVETMAKTAPGLALLGSGIFASSQYLPKLGELSEVISLRVIWSRSEDGAKKALLSARSYAPNVEAKWGQEGLEAILQDKSIQAVAIVLPAQHQVSLNLGFLNAVMSFFAVFVYAEFDACQFVLTEVLSGAVYLWLGKHLGGMHKKIASPGMKCLWAFHE